ncbi:8-amino-7-oxononanoate synthase [Nocardioides sp.]|uniref:8-amino-7-oxononanoate synthase n=1 Tax=Nocardioides sp. TaxID=35761 RepID=UPI001A30B77F|nr:8-amino-7-oxononanoate synthase [Nocardioides sp.]MBJ7357471.1 8-amino-7-oxononanoate synthase [Nocardioides sp.]
MTWSRWLAEQAVRRDDAGLRRTLLPRGRRDGLVDLAGNDYLGLSRDPVVTAAAATAAQQWGAGAGASRLVTGTLDLHVELERALASYTGQPAALVTGSGYSANLAVVTALADRDCLIVSDAHIHASLVDAARLSRAEIAIVPHSDVGAVRAALEGADGRRTLVLAESIYSVLGDEGPLVELAEACAEHGALLLVDEAHGLGVHGPGVVHRLGLSGLSHVVVTLTLSKSLGSQGGAVLGPPELLDHLVNTARPFIFDTALAPAAAGAALAALGVLRDRPELPALVRSRVDDLAHQLGVEAPQGAVVSLPMPSPQAAVAAQAAARAQGVQVGCFRPPSVPDGISRLRITVSAGVAEADWARAVTVLIGVAKEHA